MFPWNISDGNIFIVFTVHTARELDGAPVNEVIDVDIRIVASLNTAVNAAIVKENDDEATGEKLHDESEGLCLLGRFKWWMAASYFVMN